MNRIYIVLPVVLMAVFAFFYSGAAKDAEVKEQAKRTEEAKKKEAENVKKRELEEKAKVDAEKRTAERVQEDLKREADRVARYQAAVKRIQDDIDRYNSDVDLNTKLVAKLEKEIADMRARREKEGRESFDLVKRVELAKIQRRNAELEIQRYTEMIVRKAAESSMTKGPVVAVTAPAK
jgi:chromosome segregation ATPase